MIPRLSLIIIHNEVSSVGLCLVFGSRYHKYVLIITNIVTQLYIYCTGGASTTVRPTVRPTARPTVRPTTPDFREAFDRLWLAWLNERIREGEMFIERLNDQLKEYQAHRNKALGAQIEQETEIVLADVKASLSRMETELKKPGLDLDEKYAALKADAIAKVVIQLLTEVQKQVKQ